MLVNRVHKPHSCRICGNVSGIKVCKCQKAFYCSKNCQKIDWKVHKSDCYKFVEHPISSKHSTNDDSLDSSANGSAQHSLHHQPQQYVLETNAALPQANQQQQEEISRERRQYDPTPMQYQQSTILTNTTAQPSSTIDDFEENLLNSLMYSVDEGTEKEILNNLNITDELLTTFSLVNDTSSSFDDQNLNFTADDQTFDEKIFNQIERRESYELKPEYKETRDKLEKELSLFREINLHEPQQQLNGQDNRDDHNSAPDIMQISSKNPKYINHARLDDHLLYK